MKFEDWLNEIYTMKNGTKVTDSTVFKYVRAVNTISKEMNEEGLIDKSLESMELVELDLAIELILNNQRFIDKDKTGHGMYSNALKKFRCYKYHNSNLELDENEEEIKMSQDKSIKPTEREELIKSRRGQGEFRTQLMLKYNNQCIMTEITVTKTLIASHIKPWAVCSNSERLDVNNGLLLSATYDKLFDCGLITFDKKGKLKVSDFINDKNKELLNLKSGEIYDIKCSGNMEEYLKYHNEVIFVK